MTARRVQLPAPLCVRERLPEYTQRESLWCDRCRGYSGWKREECPFKPDSYLDDLAGIPR